MLAVFDKELTAQTLKMQRTGIKYKRKEAKMPFFILNINSKHIYSEPPPHLHTSTSTKYRQYQANMSSHCKHYTTQGPCPTPLVPGTTRCIYHRQEVNPKTAWKSKMLQKPEFLESIGMKVTAEIGGKEKKIRVRACCNCGEELIDCDCAASRRM